MHEGEITEIGVFHGQASYSHKKIPRFPPVFLAINSSVISFNSIYTQTLHFMRNHGILIIYIYIIYIYIYIIYIYIIYLYLFISI
jgi:hypothetical protein